MKGHKQIPGADTLYLTRQGKVFDSVSNTYLKLDTSKLNPRPRLKTSLSRSQNKTLTLCYLSNCPKSENKYRERSVAKLVVELYKPEYLKKLNRSVYIEFADGDYTNCSLGNLVFCKYNKPKDRSVIKSVKPRKKTLRRKSRAVESDSSWMTGDDTYF